MGSNSDCKTGVWSHASQQLWLQPLAEKRQTPQSHSRITPSTSTAVVQSQRCPSPHNPVFLAWVCIWCCDELFQSSEIKDNNLSVVGLLFRHLCMLKCFITAVCANAWTKRWARLCGWGTGWCSGLYWLNLPSSCTLSRNLVCLYTCYLSTLPRLLSGVGWMGSHSASLYFYDLYWFIGASPLDFASLRQRRQPRLFPSWSDS